MYFFNTLTVPWIDFNARRNSRFSKLCIEANACIVRTLSLRVTLKVMNIIFLEFLQILKQIVIFRANKYSASLVFLEMVGSNNLN